MKQRSKKEEMTIYEKAVRLVEGGHVEIGGLWVKAKSIGKYEDACFRCEMDSICRGEFADVCRECDSYGRGNYLLQLVN